MKVIGERWQILSPLREGGQAHTFRVRDRSTNTDGWVLKRLKNLDRIDRFKRELTALARLTSEHVPRIVDYSIGDPSYHVTPYVGQDLERLAVRPTVASDILRQFRQVVVAANDAHAAGVIHRDIKPNNVVVAAAGTVFLVDFGICADTQDGTVLTTTAEGFGNRAFAAPECEPGSLAAATPKSDVYSLGKLLFWMSSARGFMAREDFDLGQLSIDDEHARHYLARLLGKTVHAEAARRWTALELLAGIDWRLAKLDEHSSYVASGLSVLVDTFGPSNERYSGESHSATLLPYGNPPADHDVAEAFVMSRPASLERIELALRTQGGSGQANVSLHEDDGGLPSATRIADWHRHVSSSIEGEIVALEPLGRVELRAGQTYWVCLSADEPGSAIAWISGSQGIMPRRAVFAERDAPRKWRPAVSTSGPGHALRVITSPPRTTEQMSKQDEGPGPWR